MRKICVVEWGTWAYEDKVFCHKYFETRVSALKFALSLRKERDDDYYKDELYQLPFSNCYKLPDGRRYVSWSTGCEFGALISVKEEELLL